MQSLGVGLLEGSDFQHKLHMPLTSEMSWVGVRRLVECRTRARVLVCKDIHFSSVPRQGGCLETTYTCIMELPCSKVLRPGKGLVCGQQKAGLQGLVEQSLGCS